MSFLDSSLPLFVFIDLLCFWCDLGFALMLCFACEIMEGEMENEKFNWIQLILLDSYLFSVVKLCYQFATNITEFYEFFIDTRRKFLSFGRNQKKKKKKKKFLSFLFS